MPDPRTVLDASAMVDLLLRTAVGETVGQTLRATTLHAPPHFDVEVLSALADPAPGVRVEAALALGEGGFREALRPLLALKASDPAPEVRRAAAGALRKLQPR